MPPPHQTVEYTGAIADVFAHRFVLATAQGNILADFGPKGAALFAQARKSRPKSRFIGSRTRARPPSSSSIPKSRRLMSPRTR